MKLRRKKSKPHSTRAKLKLKAPLNSGYQTIRTYGVCVCEGHLLIDAIKSIKGRQVDKCMLTSLEGDVYVWERILSMSPSILSYSQLKWPNTLTNFDDATCTSNAAMCCWPKDRQANRLAMGTSYATPYNESVDKDVADNTKDLQAGDVSSCLIQPVDLVYIPRIIIMAAHVWLVSTIFVWNV